MLPTLPTCQTLPFCHAAMPSNLSKLSTVYVLHVCCRYGGVVVFACMTAYDTVVAQQMYANKQPDEVGVSVSLVLDFANLFVRFMKILSESQRRS